MSGLSVSIRGIIISCDIGVVKYENKTERVMGDNKKRKDGGQYLPTTYMDRVKFDYECHCMTMCTSIILIVNLPPE